MGGGGGGGGRGIHRTYHMVVLSTYCM
jgi:hypothetical protein